jgi:hypothetical protein
MIGIADLPILDPARIRAHHPLDTDPLIVGMRTGGVHVEILTLSEFGIYTDTRSRLGAAWEVHDGRILRTLISVDGRTAIAYKGHVLVLAPPKSAQ